MVADGSVAAQVSEWGGRGGEQPRNCQGFTLLQSRLHLPGWESSTWLAVSTLGQATGQGHSVSYSPQAPVLLSGERASFLPLGVYAPCRWGTEVPALRHVRGGVLPSGAFPEPVTPSYGAPGVEFMGLHRENNAVVQIYFLPGQVRGLSRCTERQAFGDPGFGADGRTWDHLFFSAVVHRPP